MALHLTGISTRAKLVMIGLADCSNDDTFTCYPSRKHLAQIGDCSVDTVDRAVKELTEALLIDVQPQYRDGTDRVPSVNLYRVFPSFDPSRKIAATRENAAGGITAELRPGSGQERGQGSRTPEERVAARDAAIVEPSYEPESVVVAVRGVDLLDGLKARADGAINLTSGHVHHAGELSRLLRGGCTSEDIENATDAITANFKARRKTFSSWAVISELAVEMRDRRLAGVPEPKAPTTPTPRYAPAESPTAVVQRLAKEGRI